MLRKIFKKHRVEIDPEEILLDKETAAKLEIPIKKEGIFIIFVIAIMILILFLTRAFWLQIWQGDYYAMKASKNSVRFYYNQAPRGIIYDRNGEILTTNEPNFTLMVIPADLPKGDALNLWIKKVTKLLKKNEPEISDFISGLDKSSTQPVSFDPPLNQAFLVEIEANLPEVPALFINKETRRQYKDGIYFSQFLGYTGKISSEELKTRTNYLSTDFIGRSGLEAEYEEDLRGQPNKIAILVDSDNKILNTVIAKESRSGNNLTISIDSDLQKLLTDVLKNKIAETNSSGAAAVVLDARSGEILALVSLPSFDNNVFTNNLSGKNYQTIIKNQNWSEFNRAIGGIYPSGSTIKPFIAAAALEENIISPETKIDDTLGYIQIPNQYNPDIIYTYRDWKAHGWVDLRKAIAWSANVYFYQIGGGYKNIQGLGIERIKKYLNIFGFGSLLGIDLPGESEGLTPDPIWKKTNKNEDWYTGDTYNVSIGQGDVLVTPLQMAAAIAAIANDGTLWQPKIVSKITDSDGKIVKEFKPKIIRDNIMDKNNLQIVREGMREAVTEGSAYFLKDLPIKVAGKTGTAQVTNTFKKTNAWFTGFAPYDNPSITLAIVIEGAGEGSTAAVPVAKEVFQWYYNKNYDKLNK